MESKDAVIFRNRSLFSTSFAHLHEMRRNGELCDLQIQVQNVSLIAHRAILAAGIPYFRTLFSDQRTEETTDISLEDLAPEMLESIIDYAYRGAINISAENVRPLLQVSEILQVREVSDACVEFLAERLLVSNVLEIHNLAISLNKSNLMKKCVQFIQENFEEFSKMGDFKNLSASCIKDIVSSDELNVPNEKIVVEAILNWAKNSTLEAHAILPELLGEIRMIYLPINYLIEQVSSDELITNSLQCSNLIEEVINCHLKESNAHPLNFKTTPRKYSIQPGIYAISRASYYEHYIYHYGFCDVTWRHITTAHTKHRDSVSSVVAVNGKLYLFFREIIQTFYPKTQEWQQPTATHNGLKGAAVVSHGNIIYCFGSQDIEFEAKLQRFDTEQERWQVHEYMKTPRCNAAAAAFGESIYVTGGYSQSKYHATVEKYNTLTRTWSQAAPLFTPRGRHACIAVNEKIYVFGGSTRGTTRGQDLRTGEMYDPLTNQWNVVSSLSFEKCLFSLVCHNNEIYALGGLIQCSKPNFEVEIYDPKRDQWRCDARVNVAYTLAVSLPLHDN